MASVQVYYMIHHQSVISEDTLFEIRRGEGFSSINFRLREQGLIKSARLFHRYHQFKGHLTEFRSGRYLLPKGATFIQVSEILRGPNSLTTRVTIPEGYNIFQIAEILENQKITSAEEFLRWARDKEYLESIGIPGPRAEGYLFPETYFLDEGQDPREVIETMVALFRRQTRDLDFSVVDLTPHEVIILASVVEKETGAPWERPRIAGVFHNRIKQRMRLQSDPTTIYGMYEEFDGRIRRSDLQRVTPYNTYRINGLPKGPIANPGLAAIKAVLDPEEHNYLYFVSRNDGTHVFSKNLRDHNNAVNHYQRNPENRRGRSWRDLPDSPHNPANQ